LAASTLAAEVAAIVSSAPSMSAEGSPGASRCCSVPSVAAATGTPSCPAASASDWPVGRPTQWARDRRTIHIELADIRHESVARFHSVDEKLAAIKDLIKSHRIIDAAAAER
jgi:hypothetical protein